jgi:hypothetical protein
MRDQVATRAKSGPVVAVFGATGHTGRFVVAELRRRGFVPVAVGRDHAGLAAAYADRGILVRIASVDEPGSLVRAFEGADAVINCAGPFLDTADAVVPVALQSGIHYLDITAEQASAQATYEAFDAPAREAGVIVMPAMGFYGGFADLLVTAVLGDRAEADEITIAIALDSWHPTRGTRLTGDRNTAPRQVIADGRLTPLPLPAAERAWAFPAPFSRQTVVEVPLAEVIVIARHVRTAELHTYLDWRALRDLRDASTPPPRPADETGRSAQRFLVEVVVRRDGRTDRLVARGRDIYAFSAPLVCEAAQRILTGAARGVGALAPGAAFDAPAFLEALTLDPISLVVTAG